MICNMLTFITVHKGLLGQPQLRTFFFSEQTSAPFFFFLLQIKFHTIVRKVCIKQPLLNIFFFDQL